MQLKSALSLTSVAFALAMACPLRAEDVATPYWASIRSNEVNMRVGPSEEYRIAWVYHRQHLPVKVLRLKEGWRLVEDQDGARGWMLSQFLTRERSAVVTGSSPAELRENADGSGQLRWRLAPGVIVQLGDCAQNWCAVSLGPRAGFVAADHLWGDGNP
jgi:SH3-like domain-containing protein